MRCRSRIFVSRRRASLAAISLAAAVCWATGCKDGNEATDGGVHKETSPAADGTGSTEPKNLTGSEGMPVDPSDPNATFYAVLVIQGTDGKPITKAEVVIDGKGQAPDEQGLVEIYGLTVGTPKAAIVRAAGYMSYPLTLDFWSSGQGPRTVVLTALDKQATFTASAGGPVDLGSYKITFAAGGLKKADGSSYDGETKVAAFAPDIAADIFDPQTKALRDGVDLSRLPFQAMMAEDAESKQTPMIPVAMLDVQLGTPTGDALDLKAGAPAKLALPLPAGIPELGTFAAGDELKTWAFDETKGLWVPMGTCKVAVDGTATRCEGEVTHFTKIGVLAKLQYRCVKISKVRVRIPADKNLGHRRQWFEGYFDGNHVFAPSAVGAYKENGVLGSCAVGPFGAARLGMKLQLVDAKDTTKWRSFRRGKIVTFHGPWMAGKEVTVDSMATLRSHQLCSKVCSAVEGEEVFVDLTDGTPKPAADAGPAKCTEGLAATCTKLTLQPASGSTDAFALDYADNAGAQCGSTLLCRICSTPDQKAATAYACQDLTLEKGKQSTGTLQNRKNPQDYVIRHCVPPTEGTACLDARLPKPE